ncbi:hypothetical protein C7271_17555 [filamentous cyanobacterium CCP5]|nr:hypothetical protein C7271_17555 [filamentous cyanobacterium CCP5]
MPKVLVTVIKTLLIKLLVLPRGMATVVALSAIALLLLNISPPSITTQVNSDREEFPDGRRGGGTHWVQSLAIT